MALPDEDRTPVWLRDWQQIEADIQAMGEFAQKLHADVEKNYVSHLAPVYDTMTTELPDVSAGFPELVELLQTHQEAVDITAHQVHDYANESAHLAAAASRISSNYHDTDAFARATVSVVKDALNQAGVGGVNNGGATAPTPEEH
jgi:methyl-accepting chemotaxis protein